VLLFVLIKGNLNGIRCPTADSLRDDNRDTALIGLKKEGQCAHGRKTQGWLQMTEEERVKKMPCL
jgi:hypothetical protein